MASRPAAPRAMTRYDTIGVGYATLRREDPQLKDRIDAALGDAETVVNVGAGTGSYEPRDRHVIAIEPSEVMAGQRPDGAVPAIRASAAHLPLRTDSVDAALAVLTVHHWGDEQEPGVRELRRVARGPVVIVTFDNTVSARSWICEDYLPEIAALDRTLFPPIDALIGWLGGTVRVEPIPVTATTPDWTLAAAWAHPERLLDPAARAATSGFALLPDAVVDRAIGALRADLTSGAWDERHGHLRTRTELDVGERLVVATPADRPGTT